MNTPSNPLRVGAWLAVFAAVSFGGVHEPPFAGEHSHSHRHAAGEHAHDHGPDLHHQHEHG